MCWIRSGNSPSTWVGSARYHEEPCMGGLVARKLVAYKTRGNQRGCSEKAEQKNRQETTDQILTRGDGGLSRVSTSCGECDVRRVCASCSRALSSEGQRVRGLGVAPHVKMARKKNKVVRAFFQATWPTIFRPAQRGPGHDTLQRANQVHLMASNQFPNGDFTCKQPVHDAIRHF